MNIRTDNICFTGRNWSLFSVFCKKRPPVSQVPVIQQADTFVRTTTPSPIDFKNIKKGRFLNSGKDANVFETNDKNYVMRITGYQEYIPEEMIPVQDGNGLIVAVNPRNTLQIQKYVKGKPLYGNDWELMYYNLGKDEFMETFDKIRELPDESFAEYIRKVVHIRKCGYDIDSLNPNNILLDGIHLNIVDIEKNHKIQPTVLITDFNSLVDFFHIRKILSTMNKEEIESFVNEIKILCDRIVNIANKEGYELQKEPMSFATVPDWYHKFL